MVINRLHPGLVILLFDQSSSMNDGIDASSMPKIEVLAKVINLSINDLITCCEKGESEPRHYL